MNTLYIIIDSTNYKYQLFLDVHSSSHAYTSPAKPSQQSHRYDSHPKESSTAVYEKRLAAMKDPYGSGSVSLTYENSSAYSDRKKDAYVGSSASSRVIDPYSSASLSSYNRPEVDARYGANPIGSSSYNRSAAPSAVDRRYDQLYPQAQNYSTPATIVAQKEPTWGSSVPAYGSTGSAWTNRTPAPGT